MSRRSNEYLPGILNGISGIAAIGVSLFVDARYEFPVGVAKATGIFLVFVGMALASWAAIHIKEAILGEVEPRLSALVTSGPYKFIRHPVYLGITTALLGSTVTVRSWLGFLIVVLFFLPSVIYRAHQEERALANKFPSEWNKYATQTRFMFPMRS
jgi:protein-S-isoprenylcysteine O-methyltransferase Ste14